MEKDIFTKTYLNLIKESTDTQYVFDEVEFDRAFKRAWTRDDTQKMKQYFRKGMTVQEIKDIYRELCQKVSDGDYKGAYRAWTKVLTSGFLFRLMWEMGYDCVVPNKINGNNLEVKFTPHVACESVYDAKRDFHSYRYEPTEEQIYNRAVKEVQKTKNVKQEDVEKLAKKITKNLMLMKSFRDEDDYNDTFWDEYAQTVNDYKFRGVIKEDVNLAPHVKKMQGYWKKDSNPQRLIKSIDNPDKLINRWLAAIKIGWTYAAEEFEKAIRERGLLTDEEIAEKKSKYSLDDEVKVPERSKEEERNLSSWTTRSVYLALQKICEERNYKFELKHSKNWNAVTDTGKECMARNGRAWTVGYELVVTNKGGTGREVHYDLDVVTNEGGGLYGYVWGMKQTWRPTSLKQLIYDMQDSFDRDFEGKKQWNW